VKDLLIKSTPGLCFDCHMTDELMGRERHGPYKIGQCGGCHVSHQGDQPKLLIARSPELCFTCHSTEDFKNKYVHKPVAEGRCFDCHGVHTTPYKGLVKADANEGCRKCHSGVFGGSHPSTPLPPDVKVRGKGGRSGHPVDKVDDPRRPGRVLSCVSCHNPHSSDWKGLFRYKAEKPADLCQHCHR
jgi:predicted CXXCH cytochrome family protein